MKRSFDFAQGTFHDFSDHPVRQTQRDREAENLPLLGGKALGHTVQAHISRLFGKDLGLGVI